MGNEDELSAFAICSSVMLPLLLLSKCLISVTSQYSHLDLEMGIRQVSSTITDWKAEVVL